MKRLDMLRAKLKVSHVEARQRQKELNQMMRAFERAVEKVNEIEGRIEHEETKLARTERPDAKV
jgi:flagellar motor switch protein FliM